MLQDLERGRLMEIDPRTRHSQWCGTSELPVAGVIFSAQQLVSKISHDMTLLPGDLICCGTSIGVGVMKEPADTITVAIDGIGELTSEYRQ